MSQGLQIVWLRKERAEIQHVEQKVEEMKEPKAA
jgi:hypothetical protein